MVIKVSSQVVNNFRSYHSCIGRPDNESHYADDRRQNNQYCLHTPSNFDEKLQNGGCRETEISGYISANVSNLCLKLVSARFCWTKYTTISC